MKYLKSFIRKRESVQPVFRLIDLFDESIAYDRIWKLPFNSLLLCVREDAEDPSFLELQEEGRRFYYEEGQIGFLTCETPIRNRYTTANKHLCILFRYELFPGVDLFDGVRRYYSFRDEKIAAGIRNIFAEPDPLRRMTMTEAVVLETALKFWPEQLPLDLEEMAGFNKLLPYVDSHLTSQLGISEMAAVMGWSEAYFCRKFHKVFHITPKQYLLRELFARAIGLLNDPRKSIKQIAEELKFSSEFNFSRFIRRCSGYSPSEFRKNIRRPLYVKK